MSNLPAKKPGSVRLVAAADLHLGRKIFVPDVMEGPLLTPEGVWEALVDLLVDPVAEVDALLLAGDLFDRDEDVLEAPFFFERGLKRLQQENLPVVAVAGNHDWFSLRKRHRILGFPDVHILGLDGAWEHCDLQWGSRIIRFEGWSFPTSQHTGNPLDSLPAVHKNIFTIGLFHGDWQNTAGSAYAPCTLNQLAVSGRRAWVLGHVHIPRILLEDPLVISCGTLQGLDASEQGARGAFLIDVEANGELHAQMLPLAAVRWETISIDVTDLQEENYMVILQKSLEEVVNQSVRSQLQCLCVEAIWKGRIDDPRKKLFLKNLEGTYFHLGNAESFVNVFLRKSTLDIRPHVDLEVLAQESSILGHVARQILQLENPEEQEQLKTIFSKERSSYAHLSLDFDLEALKMQGYEMLLELLEQDDR